MVLTNGKQQSNKLKICFFRHSLLSRGGDKMVLEYANHLKSQGHDVVILTNIVKTIFNLQPRIEKISRIRSKVGTIVNAVFNKRDYDVIIADVIMVIFFLSLRNKERLVYFSQDYDESYYNGIFMKMLIRVVYFYCLRILKIPVIAVSEDLGQLLKRRFNADVLVVPNGIDTDVFYPDRDEEYLTLKGNSKVILVFARSDYRKGFDIAAKVLLNFKKEIDIGDMSVWAVVENIDVPFKMRNFGFVPPEKLRKILSCSDALLYPSRHEGLPLFVLEAMACGCPVVTTKAVTIVQDEIDALVCEIGEVDTCSKALMKIITDNGIRDKIISNGLRKIKNYSILSSKEKFENIISCYKK